MSSILISSLARTTYLLIVDLLSKPIGLRERSRDTERDLLGNRIMRIMLVECQQVSKLNHYVGDGESLNWSRYEYCDICPKDLVYFESPSIEFAYLLTF